MSKTKPTKPVVDSEKEPFSGSTPETVKTSFIVDVYDVGIYLTFCTDIKHEFTKQLPKAEYSGNPNTCGYFFGWDNDLCQFWIFFTKEPKISDIVHECVHVANCILSDRNIRYSGRGDDEAMTYLTAFLVNKILRVIDRQPSIKLWIL